MNKLKFTLTIIASGFFYGCMDCKTIFERVAKPEIIKGVIVNRDSIHNHGIPTVEIKNNDGSIEKLGLDYSLHSLWQASQLHDSIFKDRNSLAFKIIRKDTILTFYPICDCCDTLK